MVIISGYANAAHLIFYIQKLLKFLTFNKIRSIIACGTSTGVCVYHRVESLHKLNFSICIVEDACADIFKTRHRKIIRFIKIRKRIELDKSMDQDVI